MGSSTSRQLCSLTPHLITSPNFGVKPGLYTHYKNKDIYKVHGCVLHTETNEIMVLYHAIDPTPESKLRNPSSLAFVRPQKMFMDHVEHNGQNVPRFVFMK